MSNEMQDFNLLMEQVYNDYKVAESLLTLDQFKDALVGAIKSGDFLIHCMQDGLRPEIVPELSLEKTKEGMSLSLVGYQGLSYIPYRNKRKLENKIEKLERQFAELGQLLLFANEMRYKYQ